MPFVKMNCWRPPKYSVFQLKVSLFVTDEAIFHKRRKPSNSKTLPKVELLENHAIWSKLMSSTKGELVASEKGCIFKLDTTGRPTTLPVLT